MHTIMRFTPVLEKGGQVPEQLGLPNTNSQGYNRIIQSRSLIQNSAVIAKRRKVKLVGFI